MMSCTVLLSFRPLRESSHLNEHVLCRLALRYMDAVNAVCGQRVLTWHWTFSRRREDHWKKPLYVTSAGVL